MRHVRCIHFIGIGGAGMCGIAEVMLNLGYQVSGSDIELTPVTERLIGLGATISSGHQPANVENADVVVTSSAITADNPEVLAAHAAHKPVVQRAEMLGELMRHRYGIAVAGTHGKTTTTSFIADIFQAAEVDPTYVIGGLLKSENRNAKLGAGRYIVVEADESDASFLFLHPMLTVVTNIDRDHLGTYGQDFDSLKQAFRDFISKLPFYGAVILCIDDAVARSLVDEVTRPVITYGLHPDADYRAVDIDSTHIVWNFQVERPDGRPTLEIDLPLPGIQNVQNALAAIAVASDEGLPDQCIQRGLRRFIGVGRRFEVSNVVLNGYSLPLVDDYGHHPTELTRTIETVKQVWPDRRCLMVYQPHRYSRTRDLFKDFVTALNKVEDLIILDTYAASEAPITGANATSLCKALASNRASHHQIGFASNPREASAWLASHALEDHVVMIQGAGDVSRVLDFLNSS